jgi:hypothetical protein
MTTAERTCLERSPPDLRRIVRQPAWDFNHAVTDPRTSRAGDGGCRP